MSRFALRVAAWPVLALSLAVAPVLAEQGDPMLARVGGEMFQQYCASCHGATGQGDGPAAGELRKRPADLTHIAARRSGAFPDAEIARIVDGRFDLPAHGTRDMPIWGRKLGESVAEGTQPDEVARGKIMALVEYLKTIQKP
jgi:mono/diheme cytochrome c family protein